MMEITLSHIRSTSGLGLIQTDLFPFGETLILFCLAGVFFLMLVASLGAAWRMSNQVSDPVLRTEAMYTIVAFIPLVVINGIAAGVAGRMGRRYRATSNKEVRRALFRHRVSAAVLLHGMVAPFIYCLSAAVALIYGDAVCGRIVAILLVMFSSYMLFNVHKSGGYRHILARLMLTEAPRRAKLTFPANP